MAESFQNIEAVLITIFSVEEMVIGFLRQKGYKVETAKRNWEQLDYYHVAVRPRAYAVMVSKEMIFYVLRNIGIKNKDIALLYGTSESRCHKIGRRIADYERIGIYADIVKHSNEIILCHKQAQA